MIVNLRLELTDDERIVFNRFIGNPKPNRACSRQDVRNFVNGCLDSALNHEEEPTPQASEIDRLPSGKIDLFSTHGDPDLANASPSYIRGWNQVRFRKELRDNE